MKVAISQSNYIPWKGYFDNIAQVDVFVLYDDMQYTKRDWRNRNKIKTAQGAKWLSVPVQVKGKFHQKINETFISDSNWKEKHLDRLLQNYRKAKCFKEVETFVKNLYTNCNGETISEVNTYFLKSICDHLGIGTKIIHSSDFELAEEKTQRLVDICKALNATEYYTGAAAKSYMNEDMFNKERIEVKYFDYSNYTPYDQLYGEFDHHVTILDLIFSEGKNAKSFLKYIQ